MTVKKVSSLAIASVLTGLLLGYALPPHDLWWLGWIALLPMLAVVRKIGPAGVLTGGVVVAFVLLSTTVGGPLHFIGNGLCFYLFLGLALLFGSVFLVSAFLWERMRPLAWCFMVAFLGVTADHFFSFYAPVCIPICQYNNPAALHLASYTGIWGVGFLLWLVPTLISVVVSDKSSRRSSLLALTGIFGLMLVLGLTHGRYGGSGKTIAVAAMQSPGAGDCRFETIGFSRDLEFRGDPKIAVWPEQSLGERDKTPLQAVEQSGVYVVAHVPESNVNGKSYNSAMLISPDGEITGRARKHHLFGGECRYYYSGHSKPIKTPYFNAGIAICYDLAFTDVTRDLARNGADIILVPTYDPLSPGYAMNSMHRAMAAFRAAENAVPLVWADASAFSTIIDGSGNPIVTASKQQPARVQARIALRGNRTTFFTRAGDYFLYISIAGALLIPILGRKPRPKKQSDESQTLTLIS